MTTETPKPVGYWCDHTDEPLGHRTHEGWDWTDDGRAWAPQPDTITAHTGLDTWDPEQRRCPKAVPVYAIDAPALTAHVEQLTAAMTGWRQAYERVALHARRFRWAWQSAARGRRQARTELARWEGHDAVTATLIQQAETERDEARKGKVEQMLGRLDDWGGDLATVVQERDAARAERDEVLAEMREEARTADELRRNRDQLHDELTTARAELDTIRTSDETVGGVLYDVVRRAQTGELDEHQAVRAIDARLIHPLVAREREARARAARSGRRRRDTRAAEAGRNAAIGLVREAYRDAGVHLKDSDPWPTWGPSIDALDILRALGALEGTVATTLAGDRRG